MDECLAPRSTAPKLGNINATLLPGNYGQNQRGTVFGVVIDSLMCSQKTCGTNEQFTGIQIPIEPWKVTARNVESNAVPRFEHIARRPEINVVFVDLARYNLTWL